MSAMCGGNILRKTTHIIMEEERVLITNILTILILTTTLVDGTKNTDDCCATVCIGKTQDENCNGTAHLTDENFFEIEEFEEELLEYESHVLKLVERLNKHGTIGIIKGRYYTHVKILGKMYFWSMPQYVGIQDGFLFCLTRGGRLLSEGWRNSTIRKSLLKAIQDDIFFSLDTDHTKSYQQHHYIIGATNQENDDQWRWADGQLATLDELFFNGGIGMQNTMDCMTTKYIDVVGWIAETYHCEYNFVGSAICEWP